MDARRCEHERTVRLMDDVTTWEQDLMNAWADLVVPNQEIIYWVVHPEVPDMQPPNCAHLILVQEPPDGMIAALFSMYDGLRAPDQPFRVAQFTDEWVTCEAILSATYVLGDCLSGEFRDLCSCWHKHDQLVVDGQPKRGHQGCHYFVLVAESFQPIRPRGSNRKVNLAPEPIPEAREDATAFLQLHSFQHDHDQPLLDDPPQTLRLQDHLDAPPEVCIDFASVFALHDILCHLQLPIQQAWPDLQDRSDLIQPAWAFPFWNHAPFTHVAFYTDGSFHKLYGATAAVVCLVSTADGWQVLGHIKYKCFGEYAYQGEYSAIACALLWACQISERNILAHGACHLTFSFHFDCVAAGYIAAGHWQSVHPEWSVVLRSLCQILQTNHGFDALSWVHAPAHTGDLWNEMCDSLAKWIATQDVSRWSEPWQDWLASTTTTTALQWLWSLRPFQLKHHALPRLQGHMIHHILDQQPLSSEPARCPESRSAHAKTIVHSTCVATANVLTLEDRKLPTVGARQLVLMQQFWEAGADIVCLQETRHKKISQNNELFHVYGCPATPQGHEGVQIWVRRRWNQPKCALDVPFQSTKIVAMEPTFMIAKITVGTWKTAIINVHAPHADHGAIAIRAFWTRIQNIVHDRCQGWNLLLAGDMNAHVGSVVSDAIGGHCQAVENTPGQVFHDWLLVNTMWAPSTFEPCQKGDSATYVSVRGENPHRLDYICLPHSVDQSSVSTWVDRSIDLATQKSDHFPTFCRWDSILTVPNRRQKTQQWTKLSASKIRSSLDTSCGQAAVAASLTLPDWHLNIHQHADGLAAQTRDAFQHMHDDTFTPLRKRHLSPATQQLVRTKQQAFQAQKASQSQRKTFMARFVFASWRRAVNHDCTAPSLDECDAWLKDHDKLSAMQLHHQRTLTNVVRQAVRDEDAAFFTELAQSAGQAYTQEGLQALWKKVKNLLPKHRAKRLLPPRDFGQELQSHFETLEAGRRTTWSDHLHQCHDSQQAFKRLQPFRQVALAELPTLVEIEDLSRRQKSHRAPGPDAIPGEVCRHGSVAIGPALHNVALKAVLNSSEPCTYKGGHLCAIFKGKGSIQQASGYRGIMLSNVFAKVIHAWARKRLLPTYCHRACPGQIGGLPSQQTHVASHLLRLHEAAGVRHKKSTAVLFLDVRSAFHHMLREWIFSVRNPWTRDTLAGLFDDREHDVDRLLAALDDACTHQPTDMPPLLRNFLHDLHQHTWFQLKDSTASQPVTATSRGTRPGSPMADIGFNLLVSKLLAQITTDLQEVDLFRASQSVLEFACPPLAWVDDIAIPLATDRPADLPILVERCAAITQHRFFQAGLTLNYDRGKTEAVMSFRGAGSNEQKLKTFVATEAPVIHVATDDHLIQLRIAADYKHLGMKFCMDADLHHEIHCRLGMARAAYQEIKTSVLQNRRIPAVARLQLFDSLIASRLFYGCATWSWVSASDLAKLEAQLMTFYRRILDIGFWNRSESITDQKLRAMHGLPTFRILWEKIRLGYLRHVALCQHSFYHEALIAEFETGRGWLHEVHHGLQWLSSVVPLPFEVPSLEDCDWFEVWTNVAACTRWKSILRRAVQRHIKQETLAYHTCALHEDIFRVLQDAGLQPTHQVPVLAPQTDHACPTCTEAFSNAKLLALHQYHAHKCHSAESAFVQGTVCPGCLKQFWTTIRLIQHLKYRPNRCFYRLQDARLPEAPANIKLPPNLKNVKRLPSYRSHQGPLRPTPHQRTRSVLVTRLYWLRQTGLEHGCGWDLFAWPSEVLTLTAGMQKLWHCFQVQECDDATLADKILNFIEECPVPQGLALAWLAYFVQECDVDDPFSVRFTHQLKCLLRDVDYYSFQAQIHDLQTQIEGMEVDVLEDYSQLEVQMRLRRDRTHPIVSQFLELPQREHEWRGQFGEWLPQPSRLLASHGRYVIHLYSGRRRRGDFHWWYEALANGAQADTQILSLDTAIDASMNVHDPALWTFLLQVASQGAVEAILLGPPCETWSAARLHQLADQRGPRPLRSRDSPWGLALRTWRELAQLEVGTCLLLKGLLLAVCTALCGGAAILEHPAEPGQPDAASIWRTALMTILRDLMPMFDVHTCEQWRHGSKGVKPTSFLYANTALPDWLRSWEIATATRPTQGLIGRDAAGQFRTMAAKEYPSRLNAGLAAACHRFHGTPGHAPPPHEFLDLAQHLIRCSSSLEGGTILPDYQPMG